MLKKRVYRIVISMLATAMWMLLLYYFTNSDNPSRILVLLGGTMPEGLIQGVTYFLFIFGLLELIAVNKKITFEEDVFTTHPLPEQENWVLNADDVTQIKLNMQKFEKSRKYLMTDIIIKACIKYRLSKSSSEALGVVESQTSIYDAEMESEQSFINYVAWAIPSVGFIGTVLGIAASLGYANEASTPEGLNKVTSMLGVAFDTTLVALVLSIFLMWGIHYVHKRQDSLFAKMKSYVIENLINRLYK